MALDFMGPTQTYHWESQDDRIFEVIKQLDLKAPQFENIFEAYYSDPNVVVETFHKEINLVLTSYQEHRKAELIRERKIRAKNPEVLRSIVQPMLDADPIIQTLQALQAVCEDAMLHGQGIQCVSD